MATSPITITTVQVRGREESWASSPGVRRSMLSNRGRDTRLELALRSRLHHAGYRYWIHRRPEPAFRCLADIVFPRLKLAVFVDGCFWHGCPTHGTLPVANGDWWRVKLEGNKARDRRNGLYLGARGWTVLRVWEHESVDGMYTSVANTVQLLRNLGDWSAFGPFE